MWFEEISFRGFPGKLKSVGRTVAVAVETAAPAEMDQKQLEQLERLRSEISQVKTRQSQSCKVYKIAKSSNFKNFAMKFTQDTHSEVAW